jgi:predicted  nucleic acid-binding Zn-ribbon protein
MPLFRNFYTCYRCGYEWQDIWSATCDDDCPHCGARYVSPTESEDAKDDNHQDAFVLFS